MPCPSLPHRLQRTPLALCCLALSAATVHAADDLDASFDVGRVVISAPRGGPLSSRKLLTSVDLVHADALAAMAVQATWELFSLVPGTLLTGFDQGTTSGKVSLRGFNGEGEVNAVKLLIDGLPANGSGGNMPDLDMVFPLALQTIELVRGTNDARFGLHNVASNINLVTQRGGNDLQSRAARGSFNSLDGVRALPALEPVYQALLQAHPQRGPAWRIELPQAPGETITARFLKPVETAGQGFGPLLATVDPVSLQVVANRLWGQHLGTWLYDLHYSLLPGEAGMQWVGGSGLLLLVCLCGLLPLLLGLTGWLRWRGKRRARAAGGRQA